MSSARLAAPDGMVTFVFTDIEGSTRLFHQLGQAYVSLLDRHNQLLRLAWADHRGYEVSTEGDSFFVAFQHADDAVRACSDAQRRLAAEPWAQDARVRIRIGIHTGLASPRDGGYVALAVHQAARISAAGHGGQVLGSLPRATPSSAGALLEPPFVDRGPKRARECTPVHQADGNLIASPVPMGTARRREGFSNAMTLSGLSVFVYCAEGAPKQ